MKYPTNCRDKYMGKLGFVVWSVTIVLVIRYVSQKPVYSFSFSCNFYIEFMRATSTFILVLHLKLSYAYYLGAFLLRQKRLRQIICNLLDFLWNVTTSKNAQKPCVLIIFVGGVSMIFLKFPLIFTSVLSSAQISF